MTYAHEITCRYRAAAINNGNHYLEVGTNPLLRAHSAPLLAEGYWILTGLGNYATAAELPNLRVNVPNPKGPIDPTARVAGDVTLLLNQQHELLIEQDCPWAAAHAANVLEGLEEPDTWLIDSLIAEVTEQ